MTIFKKKIITISLSEKAYNFLERISFAKKNLPKGTYSDTHHHRLFSAYLVKNMEGLQFDDRIVPMPPFALVIVFPMVNHTWINKNGRTDDCYVSDMSPAHGEHRVYSA